MEKIILASGSPRRKELLSRAGCTFDIVPSGADEHIDEKNPGKYVELLSKRKCEDVAARFRGHEHIVIGADTVVALGDKILGKPRDAADAARMLECLSGKTHSVYTGITLINTKTGAKKIFHEKTLVSMYPLSEKEIDDYIKTGEPMDKAGAYAIQGKGALLIKSINGDYNNVVGLPLARLLRELSTLSSLRQE